VWIPLSLVPWPLLHDLCAQAFAVFYDAIRFSAQALSRIPGLVFDPSLVPWLVAGTGLAAVLAAAVLPVKRGMERGPA
jgi:hypothetical protein